MVAVASATCFPSTLVAREEKLMMAAGKKFQKVAGTSLESMRILRILRIWEEKLMMVGCKKFQKVAGTLLE